MKMKKIILLCTVIGILLIMVSVIFFHKNQKDSQPDQAAINSVDLSEQKEEALQQIEEAYQQLSAEDQENCTEYMEQARNNIENADTERTIQAVLTQTLEYLQGQGKEASEETVSKSNTGETEIENEELYPLGKEKDGREYTPISNPSNWEYLSETEQEGITKTSIPVLEDENHTIDVICQDLLSSTKSYSYTLSTELGLWCQEQGIEASAGEYLTYGSYEDNKESFYISLNDKNETVLLVTYYKKTISWSFEPVDNTKEEILQRVPTEEGDAGLPE
ncbi:MAG: hypothetical protein ACLTPC_03190 [Lacrimispora saccharolytica]